MDEDKIVRQEENEKARQKAEENRTSRKAADSELSVPELLRRQLRLTRAMFITGAASFVLVLAACLLVVPSALRTLNEANQLIRDADTLIVQLDGVDQAVASLSNVALELEKTDLPQMLDEIGKLVGASQEAIAETRKKIDSMDIDSLNEAIADLSAVVSPLAKLFGGK